MNVRNKPLGVHDAIVEDSTSTGMGGAVSNRQGSQIIGKTLAYQVIDRLRQTSDHCRLFLANAPGAIRVIIKVLDLTSLPDNEFERYKSNQESLKKISHPFLLVPHACWIRERVLYIVLPLMEGVLSDCLRFCPRGLPAEDALKYLVDAAEAVDHHQSHGVLFDALDSNAIFVCGHHACVAYFGRSPASLRRQRMGNQAGIFPVLSAPERSRASPCLQSSQYELAAIYAHMRRGESIPLGHDPLQLRKYLSPLPQAEHQVLSKAMSVDPNHRYPTCTELALAMREAVAPLRRSMPPPTTDADRPRRLSKSALRNAFPAPPEGPVGCRPNPDVPVEVSKEPTLSQRTTKKAVKLPALTPERPEAILAPDCDSQPAVAAARSHGSSLVVAGSALLKVLAQRLGRKRIPMLPEHELGEALDRVFSRNPQLREVLEDALRSELGNAAIATPDKKPQPDAADSSFGTLNPLEWKK